MKDEEGQTAASVIPVEAEEHVTERYALGEKKQADYYLGGKEVGRRWFYANGGLSMEISVRDGRQHGPFREWYESGSCPRRQTI